MKKFSKKVLLDLSVEVMRTLSRWALEKWRFCSKSESYPVWPPEPRRTVI